MLRNRVGVALRTTPRFQKAVEVSKVPRFCKEVELFVPNFGASKKFETTPEWASYRSILGTFLEKYVAEASTLKGTCCSGDSSVRLDAQPVGL